MTVLPQQPPEPARIHALPQPARVQPREVSRPSRSRRSGGRPERKVRSAYKAETLEWPKSFDDWMIDIVRRRALRLNSGARRRGVLGSVRAVELGHILEQSADAEGRWRCALCHEPVTLDELSFDHMIALADGGEHASHNLVPAHRKCNEVKGSEKAQTRALARDRWLDEWASSGAALYAKASATRQPERRYA